MVVVASESHNSYFVIVLFLPATSFLMSFKRLFGINEYSF